MHFEASDTTLNMHMKDEVNLCQVLLTTYC